MQRARESVLFYLQFWGLYDPASCPFHSILEQRQRSCLLSSPPGSEAPEWKGGEVDLKSRKGSTQRLSRGIMSEDAPVKKER